jgi:hypothetical protein
MNISNISSALNSSNVSGISLATIKTDYNTLVSAIKNVDVSAAKTAYSTLKKDLLAVGKLPSSDLTAIYTALEEDDIDAAKEALSILQSSQKAVQETLKLWKELDIIKLLFGDNTSSISSSSSDSSDNSDESIIQTASTNNKENDGSYLA